MGDRMAWKQLQPDNPRVVYAAAQSLDLFLGLAQYSPGYRDADPNKPVSQKVAADLRDFSPDNFSIVTSLVLAKFVQLKRWEMVSFLTAVTARELEGQDRKSRQTEGLTGAELSGPEGEPKPSFAALRPLLDLTSEQMGVELDAFSKVSGDIRAVIEHGSTTGADLDQFLTPLTEAIVQNDYKAALRAVSKAGQKLSTDTHCLLSESLARLVDFDLQTVNKDHSPFSSLGGRELGQLLDLLYNLNREDTSQKLIRHMENCRYPAASWGEVGRELEAAKANLLAETLIRPEDSSAVRGSRIVRPDDGMDQRAVGG